MFGPGKTVNFVSRDSRFFSETKSRGTARFEGNKVHCFPRDQSLSDLLSSFLRRGKKKTTATVGKTRQALGVNIKSQNNHATRSPSPQVSISHINPRRQPLPVSFYF